MVIELGLEERVLNTIVFIGVKTELLHFVLRHGHLSSALSLALHFFDVSLRVGSEAAQVYFARSHGSLRINDDGNPGFLMSLVESLSAYVDA